MTELKMTIPKDFPGRYFQTKEAAQILGLSSRTMEKHRSYGTGPQFLKLGGRVVYKLEDLHSWASRGTRRSTSEKGQGAVLPAKRHDPGEITRAAGAPKPETELE
jgi:predicted DNA-binding transcriptional regulator AlpA